jgi:Homeodomain-like domain-containing protein
VVCRLTGRRSHRKRNRPFTARRCAGVCLLFPSFVWAVRRSWRRRYGSGSDSNGHELLTSASRGHLCRADDGVCASWDAVGMRYADGGGLTAEQRRRREEVRMRAVDLFEEGMEAPCMARELRVSEKSVYQWCRAWKSGGREALRSRGPCGYDCRLGPHLQAKLAAWLDEGPAATAGRTTRCGPPDGYAR